MPFRPFRIHVRLPAHCENLPELLKEQTISDLKFQREKELKMPPKKREIQKAREQAKLMKKITFRGADGEEMERSDLDMTHLSVRSSLSNIDSPTVFLNMLLLQKKISRENKIAQTLELAAQYDHILQKMSSRRIGLCLLFGDNGKWKIHQLAYENTMFVISFPT